MRFKEFQQVALAKDIPEKKLRRGDLATIVDVHPKNGGEVGYSIEIFNALGETIAVTTVPESLLEELTANEILHARSLAARWRLFTTCLPGRNKKRIKPRQSQPRHFPAQTEMRASKNLIISPDPDVST